MILKTILIIQSRIIKSYIEGKLAAGFIHPNYIFDLFVVCANHWLKTLNETKDYPCNWTLYKQNATDNNDMRRTMCANIILL